MSQSDVLAIFNPQTPVEPVAAPQKYDPTDDDGFKRIMDDASNKVSPPKEGNKSDTDKQDAPSSRSNLEKKPIEKLNFQLKYTDKYFLIQKTLLAKSNHSTNRPTGVVESQTS